MQVKREMKIFEETVDWRGRPSNPLKHGGMRSAVFVLGAQGFEIMAIAAVGNNLITYVMNEMHFSLAKAANTVTNFIGTVFILTLLGGYLSDSYLGCFWTMFIFALVELSGFILLSVQAHLHQLKPPACNMAADGAQCEEAEGMKAFIFFLALYLVALGSGCVKPSMLAHGGHQFDEDQSKKLSRYFNGAYLAFCAGELVALTVLVYVQTHSGMDIGFGASSAAMAVCLITFVSGALLYRNKAPRGSILTPFAQVIVAAIAKRNHDCPSDQRLLHGYMTPKESSSIPHQTPHLQLTHRFRFLNKACIKTTSDKDSSMWTLCTMAQVERVKIFILILPIFACTIVFNTILAQLQTFSVQQGSAMDTRITDSFHIPPASLQAIPYVMLIFIVPLYDTFFVPFARRITGHDSGLPPLHRIGAGLILATFSMISAAIMESKRRRAAVQFGETLSIFWITPQFLIFGISEMFTAVGLIEFFYTQSLKGMQAFLMAFTYCSYSCGFYMSSILVSLVNKVSGLSSRKGWLGDNNLNNDRLDLFYWMLAVLSFADCINYVFWMRWYLRSRSASSNIDSVKV